MTSQLSTGSRNGYLRLKRIVDLTIGTIALILVSPALLLIALAVKLGAPYEPVLFRQTRTGKDGTPFTIYKFRTMRSRDAALGEREWDSADWKGGVPDNFVFKNGETSRARVTRIGKILRKYSLDELPQLLNVLEGTMSLVGPRPELPEIAGCYSDYQAERLRVQPGITGFAQLSGRAQSHRQKIEDDIFYVRNASFQLDAKLLLRTITAVLSGRDAH